MNTNDTICKYKQTCKEQYHQTGKMGHGVGSSYRHTDMFALHYAKWLSICLDYYSCALISLCSWKAFGCKVVWWCRMVLLGWLQMDQNYWEYLMEDISFHCPTFYSPFPHYSSLVVSASYLFFGFASFLSHSTKISKSLILYVWRQIYTMWTPHGQICWQSHEIRMFDKESKKVKVVDGGFLTWVPLFC